jgi:hypothetical protein
VLILWVGGWEWSCICVDLLLLICLDCGRVGGWAGVVFVVDCYDWSGKAKIWKDCC